MKINSKKFKIRRKLPNIITVFIMIFGLIIVYFISQGQEAKAEWFNESWMYRQRVDITNSGSAQTDFQIQITLNTAALISTGKMQSDCDDIRVTDINGRIISYWVEENSPGCNNSATEIWTKVPTIPTSGATLYVYYGNPSAFNIENGNKVFEFFDNFSGSSVDTNKWTGDTSNFTVSSDQLHGSNTSYKIQSATAFTGNYLLETRHYVTTYAGNGHEAGGFWESTSNSIGTLIHATDSWYIRNDSSYVGPGTMEFNQWTGIVVKAAGASSNITITGETSGSDTDSVSNSGLSSEYIALGTRYDGTLGGQTYDADWDWIFVRKYASTEPSVGSPTDEEQSPGPIAYWKFDEGADNTCSDGEDICDSSSTGLNGTFSGDPEWQDESMCVSGKCLYFDGDGDQVTITNAPIFTTSDNWFVSFWAKIDSGQTSWQGVIYLNSGSQYGIYASHNSAPFLYVFIGGNPSYFYGSTQSYKSDWKYYTVTKSGTSFKWYINGEHDTSATKTLDTNTASTWVISFTYSNRFKGFLDEVKIYPYARSANQIKADYLSGTAGTGGSAASVSFGAKPQKWLSDNLVGYWKMDESLWDGTPGEVIDSSGNSNNGTSTSANTTSTSKFGRAGSFDGINDYVKTTYPMNPGTSSFALMAWFKTEDYTKDQEILSTYGSGSNYYELRVSSNTIWFQLRDTNGTELRMNSGITPTNGTWYHVVGVRDKSTNKLYIYINGILEGVPISDTTDNIDTVNAPWIGAYSGPGIFFQGLIDEVRIYNRALSPKEVRDLYNWAPGPVGYWKMDEKTGTGSNAVKDTSGNGNHGTMEASMTESDWVLGKYGSALDFDGSNDYVNVGSSPILNFSDNGNFSISIWIKPRTLVSAWRRGIIVQESYLNSGYRFALSNGGAPIFWTTQSGGTLSVTGGTLLVDQWSHVEVTYNNQQAYLYLNGTKVGNATGTYVAGSNALRIGSYVNEYFDGLIDEVKIYSYARTAKQVVEDMNAGHPVGGSPVGSQVGYWKFDEGYGSTVHDQTLNNNDLTITNATSSNQGKFGKALNFNGSSAYLSKTSLAGDSLNPLASITITAWIKPDAAQQGMIVSRNGPYGFMVNADRTIYLNILAGSTLTWDSMTTIDTVPQNQWSYVVGVYDGTDRKIYINGVLSKSEAHSQGGNMEQATRTFWIGYGNPGFDKYFDGLIDEVKIYSFALTEDEIKTDYNRGAAVLLGAVSTDSSGNPDWSSEREYCIPGDTTSCSAPVIEWKFDEKTGTTTNDISGNNNTGTLYNMEADDWRSSAECIHGGCVNIDETSTESIQAPHSAELNPPSLTVEGWFNLRDRSDRHILITKWYGYSLEVSYTGYPYFRLQDITPYDLVSTQAITWGQWYHIAASFDNTTKERKVYIDGKETASETASGIITYQSNTFRVGYVGDYMDGFADDVRVYDYVRTPAQIVWDYNRGGPVGWWKFDECQGTTAYDSSGFANNGSINIGTTVPQTTVGTCTSPTDDTGAWYNGVDGKYNSSLNFDGVDDYMTRNLAVSGTEATIAFWVKDPAPGVGVYLFRSDANIRTYVTAGSSLISFAKGNPYVAIGSVANPPSGTWMHLVLKWWTSGGTLYGQAYADGKPISGPVSFSDSSNGTYGTVAGFSQSGTQNAAGQIDDVRIYNYALTQEQIKNVMNQGAAIRFGPN